MNALDVPAPASAAAVTLGCTCDETTAKFYATLTGRPLHLDECPLVAEEDVVYPQPERAA